MTRLLSVLMLVCLSWAFADDLQRYPDVIAAEATQSGGAWTIRATLSSPYDTGSRYADAFRILSVDNVEMGVRILWHDHANEQPFTRSLTNVKIPRNTEWVTIQGRDKTYGWGGQQIQLNLISGEQRVIQP